MKSVLRSAFEPVPRPLSTGAQLLVVGLLVGGIAISVVEYLQHSRPGLVAQDAAGLQSAPALETDGGTPARTLPRVKGLVDVTPRKAGESGATGASAAERPATGAAREPAPAATAPMALQPGEDG